VRLQSRKLNPPPHPMRQQRLARICPASPRICRTWYSDSRLVPVLRLRGNPRATRVPLTPAHPLLRERTLVPERTGRQRARINNSQRRRTRHAPAKPGLPHASRFSKHGHLGGCHQPSPLFATVPHKRSSVSVGIEDHFAGVIVIFRKVTCPASLPCK